ncbi:MAG: hypothetical protein JWM41_1186 [Gemmatimonadetes bacterium]|nr:hypothetical protein [Gemmatimonadota bacterium]
MPTFCQVCARSGVWIAALALVACEARVAAAQVPEDTLAAYARLTVAALDGNRDARWASAVALDEYLAAVGRPQLFGMKFGGPRRVVDDPMTDAIRRRFCLPPRAKLDRFAQYGAAHRSGTLQRQPLTNMLLWLESPAPRGAIVTTLVIDCPRALALTGPSPVTAELRRMAGAHQSGRDRVVAMIRRDELTTGDDYFLAGVVLRRDGAAGDMLIAHTLFTVAALEGRDDALAESAAALDDYLTSIGRPGAYAAILRSLPPRSTRRVP